MEQLWSGRKNPGKYDGVDGNSSVRATRPVIIFCGYGSWAIVYAWMGANVEKVWISGNNILDSSSHFL